MKKVISKKTYRCVFLIVDFLMIFLTIKIVNPLFLEYFDSKGYWKVGVDFTYGQVNLFRGVYFPGLLGCFSLLGKYASPLYYIFYALVCAAFFEFIIPQLFHECGIENNILGGWRSTIALGIILVFYSGLFSYALSDMWACMLAYTALVCLVKMSRDSFSLRDFWLAFGFGWLAYVAYNIRTIYLFFLFGGVLVFIVVTWCITKVGAIKKSAGLLCGLATASIPQCILNAKYYSSFGAAVPTDGLFLTQLFLGVQNQRYDTYVGEDYGFYRMLFIDEVGKHIVANEHLEEITSYSQYLRLFMKYPMEFIGIYTRKLINMFLPIWPRMYSDNLWNRKYLLFLISYTVLFLVIGVLVVNAISNWRIFRFLLLMVIPVIAIAPGAVEGRFSLGLVLVMALTLCFNTDWKIVKQIFCKYYLSCVGLYFVGALLFVNLWSTLLASLDADIMLFLE